MDQSSQIGHRGIDPQSTYQTIRDEILDQKRCQFQLLSLAVTVTALVIAYATSVTAAPLVYLAPLVMNAVAVVIIFDKAVSIQRKVGYLQVMEEHLGKYTWMWEKQLDEFRKTVPERAGVLGDPSRKHSYVTTVGLMLLILNVVSLLLFVFAPGAWEWHRANFPWLSLGSAAVALTVFVTGAIALWTKRAHLIGGRHSGPQILKTWKSVLENWKTDPANTPLQPTATGRG